MAKFICEYCGKEFEAKPSAHRKYCSKDCSNKAAKGKPQKSRVEKIKVVCAECGKEEYVLPSRADKYLCCSVECLAKYNSKRYSKKIQCTCPICGKIFELKPFTYYKDKIHCCSKQCDSEYRKLRYLKENNPNYGNKRDKNPLFKGFSILRKNHKLEELFEYHPECPFADRNGRVTIHRYLVWKHKDKFNSCFFNEDGTFKSNVQVHHIDGNHNNNDLSNLCCISLKNHTALHGQLATLAIDTLAKILENSNNQITIKEILLEYKQVYKTYTDFYIEQSIKDLQIGVFKQEELLENPEVDNQQPSLELTIEEGSETNS